MKSHFSASAPTFNLGIFKAPRAPRGESLSALQYPCPDPSVRFLVVSSTRARGRWSAFGSIQKATFMDSCLQMSTQNSGHGMKSEIALKRAVKSEWNACTPRGGPCAIQILRPYRSGSETTACPDCYDEGPYSGRHFIYKYHVNSRDDEHQIEAFLFTLHYILLKRSSKLRPNYTIKLLVSLNRNDQNHAWILC